MLIHSSPQWAGHEGALEWNGFGTGTLCLITPSKEMIGAFKATHPWSTTDPFPTREVQDFKLSSKLRGSAGGLVSPGSSAGMWHPQIAWNSLQINHFNLTKSKDPLYLFTFILLLSVSSPSCLEQYPDLAPVSPSPLTPLMVSLTLITTYWLFWAERQEKTVLIGHLATGLASNLHHCHEKNDTGATCRSCWILTSLRFWYFVE